jgi:hypothetical protein
MPATAPAALGPNAIEVQPAEQGKTMSSLLQSNEGAGKLKHDAGRRRYAGPNSHAVAAEMRGLVHALFA